MYIKLKKKILSCHVSYIMDIFLADIFLKAYFILKNFVDSLKELVFYFEDVLKKITLAVILRF